MQTSSPSPELQRLEDLVRWYCARPAPLAGEQLADELPRKRALINRLELDFARDAARFAAGYAEDAYINPSPVSWLREACRMTSHAAATAVTVGEQAELLADSTAALVAGRIGFAHLGLMASTAEAVAQSSTSTSSFDEARLLRKAEALTVQRFRTECRHVRHAADREAFLRDQLEERDSRQLHLRSLEGGALELLGFLDAEAGAVLRSALEPLATRTPGDDRPRPRRYADALVDLCVHSLDVGLVPQRASQRTHLQVTSTLETLLDLVGAPGGELEYTDVIAGATVRRLACDSTVARVLLDAQAAVVDVGRSVRVVSGAARRALNVRDKGCRWPGCDRTASWTAAHHVVHWADGGATDLDNLVLLCGRHHWSVHEGGWQLVRYADGEVRTVPPTPAPARVWDPPLVDPWSGRAYEVPAGCQAWRRE